MGCTIGLEIISGYGNTRVYGPKSDCSYCTDISKWAENKFVKSYPCSNRPVICEQCQDCIGHTVWLNTIKSNMLV